jgi:hypothetical protein
METKEPAYRTVAFAFDRRADLEAVFHAALRWLDSVRLVPNRMHTNYNPRSMVYSYKKAYGKVVKHGFAGLTTFSLITCPEDLPEYYHGYNACIHCSNDGTWTFQYLTLAVQGHLIRDPVFDATCLQFAQLCSADWGLREFVSYCPVDIQAGAGNFLADRFFLAGFMSRICPWMLLNESHLRRLIGATRFADWVRSDSSRGALEPYYLPGRWVWKVPPGRISAITIELESADVIYSTRKHFDPWAGPFYQRITRGDLTRDEVIRLMLLQVNREGRVPHPPRVEVTRTPDGSTRPIVDEVAVTEVLKEWGHPAAGLPEPPIAAPLSAEEVLGQVLGGLGVRSSNDNMPPKKKTRGKPKP